MKFTKTKWKGGAVLAPVPAVMVTCGSEEKPNVLTIAWTGTINTNPPKTYISVRPTRHSYNIIKESKEFVINLTTASLVRATDYCGVKSGKNENKFEKMKLEYEKASEVNTVMLTDSPVTLECKVCDIIPLGTHDMFLADIVAVNVAQELIDEKGRLDLQKADLIAYSHGEYFRLGQKLGSFGYSVRKKKKKRKEQSGSAKTDK